MNKPKLGICRICGRRRILTFEHIPPKITFNNRSVRSYSGESTLQKSNGKPIKYKINQRGSGDYLLCRDCNSYCGTWYVKEFDKIAKIIGYKLLDIKDEYTEGVFELEIGKVNLLAFYKQLISILSCTLPHDNVKKLGFDKFLLEKENKQLNFNEFDIEDILLVTNSYDKNYLYSYSR